MRTILRLSLNYRYDGRTRREGLVEEECIVQVLVIKNHEVRREGLLHEIRLAEHRRRLTVTTLFLFVRFQGVKVVLVLHLA